MADTDDESKPSSLAVADNSDLYLTEHLAAHLAATRHHLTGAPEPPEPPYAPSFHPPTGCWSSAEKALFFRALSVHSRLRPDLLAASIGTKSTADVAVYLSLLREGAGAAPGTIARDQRPAAHEVSAALVALEDQLAARVCAVEPARVREELGDARAEAERAMKNGMRVRRGEGGEGKGLARDREGQDARRAAFERWRGERELGWAREDVLARLDVVGLQVLDRILRLEEERRAEGGSGDEDEDEDKDKDGGEKYEDEGEGDPARQRRSAAGPSTTLLRAASLSSIAGESHATTPPPSSPPAPISDDDKDDGGPIPPNLSPISRRRIHKRLYMRRKRAEASGAVAQLDPARLKPGRKASATSRYKQPHPKGDSESENPKQPARGDTRPYKIQRELERLGIGADYLHANGLDLFHLGALGRLMRLYPRLDASRPAGVAESLAAETIQMLRTLVVQFTRDLVRRAIALRDLDFALCAHTKVWGLGERVVRPPHVRRALELCGGSRLSKRMHFEGLLGRFSEGEESTDDDDNDDDVPLAVRARSRKAKAIARDENENGEDGEGGSDTDTGSSSQQQQQQQQAGPGKEALPHDPAAVRWSSAHRAMYSPFVYAPDLLAPAHPFGVYAPGTTPAPPDPLRPSARLRHASGEDEDEEEEEDLMPAETDDEALACELRAEAVLDAADARTAAAYEAGVWRELRGAPGRGMRKRRASGDGDVDACGEEAHAVRLRKRRRMDVQGGWTLDAAARAGIGSGAGVGAEAELLRNPDGLKVKSAAVIEDSDSDSDWIGD